MILNEILTRRQQENGLSVYDDEDMVYLNDGDKVIAVWSAHTASRTLIQFEAQIYLDNIASARQLEYRAVNQTEPARDYVVS